MKIPNLCKAIRVLKSPQPLLLIRTPNLNRVMKWFFCILPKEEINFSTNLLFLQCIQRSWRGGGDGRLGIYIIRSFFDNVLYFLNLILISLKKIINLINLLYFNLINLINLLMTSKISHNIGSFQNLNLT